jgi:predicted GTPase
VDAAASVDVRRVVEEVQDARPGVPVVMTASPVRLDDPEAVRGRRVLVVEDGPTLTHGGMPYGAGYVAAVEAGAEAIVDPRPWLAPSLREIYARYPHIGRVLPAVGYGTAQIAALRETIEQVAADLVVSATPIDLAALVQPSKRVVRARYELEERGRPGLSEIVDPFLDERFPR